jgi:hypothetical protein
MKTDVQSSSPVVHPDDFKSPSEIYREVHGSMISARVLRQLERREKQLDALLNHCDKDDGECGICGAIICPHGESLHFHHDGCPACEAVWHDCGSAHDAGAVRRIPQGVP